MKRSFDRELNALRNHLIAMGETAIRQVETAIQSLVNHDQELARQVRKGDDELDRMEVEIDREAIRIMSLHSPVASDLRLVIVGMKASHDLERVGDEANNIAKRVDKVLSTEPPLKDYIDIPRMGSLAVSMLRRSLEAFLESDVSKAIQVCQRDKEIDMLNKQLYRELTGYVLENPANTTRAIELMFVSKSLERIADHATNIAEEVVYLQKGEDIRHKDWEKEKNPEGNASQGSE